MKCSVKDCDWRICLVGALPEVMDLIEEAHLAGHNAEREKIRKLLLHGDVETRREMWNHYLDEIYEDKERL